MIGTGYLGLVSNVHLYNFGYIIMCVSKSSADAVVLIILAEWNELAALNLTPPAQTMNTPGLINFQNIYDRHNALETGFIAYDWVDP